MALEYNDNKNNNQTMKEETKYCNLLSCKECHPHLPEYNPPNQDNNTEKKNKKILYKHCYNDCPSCKKRIVKINSKIEQESYTLYDQLIKESPRTREGDFKSTLEEKRMITIGDGNCCPRSILISSDIPEEYHMTLRKAICQSLSNPTESEQIGLAAIIDEEPNYIESMSKSGTYFSELEITTLSNRTQIAMNIIREDDRYQNNNSTAEILRLTEGDVDLYLPYKEGQQGGKGNLGHYDGYSHDQITTERLKERLLKFMNYPDIKQISTITNEVGIQPTDITMNNNDPIKPVLKTFRAICINIRSIKDYVKRDFLSTLLASERIDICCIQETFLSQEDNFFLKGWRVYRGNGKTRRKGVMILINTNTSGRIKVLNSDNMDGRWIKLIIQDYHTNESRTISSVYLEPNSTKILPNHIADSDILMGDLNNYSSGLEKTNVYHHKNCKLVKIIDLPKQITDHPAILLEVMLPLKESKLSKVRILSRQIVDDNNLQIESAIQNQTNPPAILLNNPEKYIEKDNQLPNLTDISIYEEYQKLKEECLRRLNNKLQDDKKRLSLVLTQKAVKYSDWKHISQTINAKTSEIYEEIDNPDIITGFKGLYKADSIINTIQLEEF